MMLQDLMAQWAQRRPGFGMGHSRDTPMAGYEHGRPYQFPWQRSGGVAPPMTPRAGYDSSGINPNGMYTGGNQRPGLAGMFRRRQ